MKNSFGCGNLYIILAYSSRCSLVCNALENIKYPYWKGRRLMQLLRYDEVASGRLRVRVIRKNYYIINYRVASLLKNILAENLT